MTGTPQRVQLLLLSGVRLIGKPQMNEHAVAAVNLRWPQSRVYYMHRRPPAIFRQFQADRAALREFDRMVPQIEHDLAQSPPFGGHQESGLWKAGLESDGFGLGQRP